jgi:hypothetical protein
MNFHNLWSTYFAPVFRNHAAGKINGLHGPHYAERTQNDAERMPRDHLVIDTGVRGPQIYLWIGHRARIAAHVKQLLSFQPPPLALWPSGGSAAELDVALHFLNYPVHTATADIPMTHETLLEREGSPDLQTAFNDPAASRQRFVIHTRCGDQCVMTFHATDGERNKTLAELRLAPLDFELGAGRLHIDRTVVASITSRARGVPRPK